MNTAQTRSFWLALWLSVPLAGGGCGEDSAPSQPTPVDNTIRMPASPGEPTSLARVTGDQGYQIERMRLTGNYLYFATHVLYRMPKYGGELTVVDTKVDDRGLAANRDHVFWAYDHDTALSRIDVGQYSALGAPEGLFPIDPRSSLVSSWEGSDFLATDEALYVWAYVSAGPSGPGPFVVTRYPFDGTAPNDVLVPPYGANWVVDSDRVYYNRCEGDGAASSCAVESVPLVGGAPTGVAVVPGSRFYVVAVDAEAVYLAGQNDIVRVAKADGTLTQLFTASTEESLSARMVVDARNLYCVVFGGSVPRVMSVPKDGQGAAVEIGHSLGLKEIFHSPPNDRPGIILGFEQDEHNLFILPASSEIFMFPKEPF
jgi:hypothetical protein